MCYCHFTVVIIFTRIIYFSWKKVLIELLHFDTFSIFFQFYTCVRPTRHLSNANTIVRGVTFGAGSAIPSGASELIPDF